MNTQQWFDKIERLVEDTYQERLRVLAWMRRAIQNKTPQPVSEELESMIIFDEERA